jgi:tetratricopeptide (TPR) repeat protein
MMRVPTLRDLTTLAVLAVLLAGAAGCGRRVDPRVQEAFDLIMAHQTDQAIALASSLLAEDPQNAPACNVLGLARYEAGDPEAAAEQYRRALEIDPEFPEAHFNLGNAYMALGRAQDAETEFAAAVRHQKKFVLARYNLAHLYDQTGRREQAMTELRRAVDQDPQFIPGFVLLGRIAYDEGDFEASIPNLARALELDPRAKGIRVLLGNAYLQSGREDAVTLAESEFRTACEADSTYLDALYSLGMVLAVQGRNEEAAEWLRRARPLAEQQPEQAALVKQVDAFFERTGLGLEGAPSPAAEG